METKTKFIDTLRHNWYIKLICLIAAILIYVFYKASLIDSKTFIVPLQVIENGTVTCVEEPKSTIKIVVRTDSENMGSIHYEDFSASINLNYLTKSETANVPVKINFPSSYLTLEPFEVRSEPETIKVKVEKKDLAYIKLNPIFIGEPAHGYQVSGVTIEPEYVEVSGAESVLNATEYINTNAIDISNARTEIDKAVTPIEINNQLKILNKGPYSVKVTFEAKLMEKEYESVPVYVNGLWPDFKVEGNIEPVKVILEGAVNALETYEIPSNCIVVDVTEISEPGVYELPLTTYFANNITVKEISAEKVNITIVKNEEEQVAAEKQISVVAPVEEEKAPAVTSETGKKKKNQKVAE